MNYLVNSVFVVTAVALSGCSENFDGAYLHDRFGSRDAMLLVGGDTTQYQEIINNNDGRKIVTHSVVMDSEREGGKLTLRMKSGKTLVYVRAADGEGLECLRDSCKGFPEIFVFSGKLEE